VVSPQHTPAAVRTPVQNSDKSQSQMHYRRSGASAYLYENYGIRIATRTLAKIACISSDGPEMRYMGRIPYYSQNSLDEYAQRKIGPACRSTSERGRGSIAAPGSSFTGGSSLKQPPIRDLPAESDKLLGDREMSADRSPPSSSRTPKTKPRPTTRCRPQP
jgi:hypothetical protein